MNKINTSPRLFDEKGWRLPNGNYETFSESPKWFFKLGDDLFDDKSAISRIFKYQDIESRLESLEALSKLENGINSNVFLKNLNKGIKIPFVIKKTSFDDIGKYFEDILLEKVSKSFTDFFPESHFKAVIQDKTDLKGKLFPSLNSGYDNFLSKLSKSDICGYYFPQVLQEYSVDAQILQMKDLKNIPNICLSGPIEVAISLIGNPNLLINKKYYSPVLCLSGVSHIDKRLISCFKSYGRHLEFWCLSQMLSKDKKQVSEQWSGGLSIFTEF